MKITTLKKTNIKFDKLVSKLYINSNPYYPDWDKVKLFWIEEIIKIINTLIIEMKIPSKKDERDNEYKKLTIEQKIEKDFGTDIYLRAKEIDIMCTQHDGILMSDETYYTVARAQAEAIEDVSNKQKKIINYILKI